MTSLTRRNLLLASAAVLLAPSRSALAAKPGPRSALLVVDVQNCFVSGGTLAVKDGEQVVPVINRIAPAFENIVMTQDWHTPGHASFASSHAGKKPFERAGADRPAKPKADARDTSKRFVPPKGPKR